LCLSALAVLGFLLWMGSDAHVLIGTLVSVFVVAVALISLGLKVLLGNQ
jgi:hypothetical protein